MAWPAIGKAFTPAEFAAYVKGLRWDGTFRPDGIVLHNTAAPCLANRPAGFNRQQMVNFENYYKNECKWSGGPHLFVDDKAIWVFNELTKRGTHSPSFNDSHIGIEMLGDFDKESFTEGRGRKVRDNAVAAMAILNNRLGFKAEAFKFHIEDKRSDHACPGKLARAEREALIAEVQAAMAAALPAIAAVGHGSEPDMDEEGDPETLSDGIIPPRRQPAAAAPSPGKIATAYKSNSVWALINAKLLVVIGGFLGMLKELWEWLLNILDVLPAVSNDVGETLTSSEKIAGWFKLDPMTWAMISGAIAVPLIILAIVRHTNDKQQVEQKAQTP